MSSGLRMNVRAGGDRVNRPYDVSDRVLLMGAGLRYEVWPGGRGRGGRGGHHSRGSLMVKRRVRRRQEMARSDVVAWSGLLAAGARKCLIWSRCKHGLLGKTTFKLVVTLKVCGGLLGLVVRGGRRRRGGRGGRCRAAQTGGGKLTVCRGRLS